MKAWTLGAEICALSGYATLQEACAHLGLTSGKSDNFQLGTIRPWFRSGAETYSMIFGISHGPQVNKFVLKAAIGSTPAISVENEFRARLRRRSQLRRAGCPVPRIYGARAAVYIEEFLECDLWHIAGNGLTESTQRLILRILEAIARRGFRPLSLLPNMMCGSGGVFWVDFGTDLGNKASTAVGLNELAEQFLRESKRASGDRAPTPSLIMALALGA